MLIIASVKTTTKAQFEASHNLRHHNTAPLIKFAGVGNKEIADFQYLGTPKRPADTFAQPVLPPVPDKTSHAFYLRSDQEQFH